MKLLFEIDLKNYDLNGTKFIRPSVRAVIVKDGRLAMVHSLKYDYYKFPGGGIEENEDHISAIVREVREETGLEAVRESIKEYGYVHRIEKGDIEDVFIQDNYYYFCEVRSDRIVGQELDDYEAEEGFTLEYVLPEDAVRVNNEGKHYDADEIMIKREALVICELIKDGYFTGQL